MFMSLDTEHDEIQQLRHQLFLERRINSDLVSKIGLLCKEIERLKAKLIETEEALGVFRRQDLFKELHACDKD
jgi:uncharacterized small protein (DUF1192 family)